MKKSKKRFIVSSSRFLEALKEVKSLAPSNNALPIISDAFLLTTGKDELEIQTNHNLHFVKTATVYGIESKEQFSVVVNELSNLIKLISLEDEQPLLFILGDDGKMHIQTDDSAYVFSTENEGDWVRSFVHKDNMSVTDETLMSYDKFVGMMKMFTKYTSNDELRQAVLGIYYDSKKDRFVATNSHYLRFEQLDFQFDDSFIMRNPIKHLPKTKMQDKNVTFSCYGGGVAVGVSYEKDGLKYDLAIRTIDERFPDYMNVIPTEFTYKLTLKKSDILKAIKKATITANDTTHQVILELSDEVRVKSYDLDFGKESDIKVPFDEIFKNESAEDVQDVFQIGLNGVFGVDVLNAIDDDEIKIYMNKPNQAFLVNMTSLLMPVMINNP